jgi:preprotein translocase subunit SecY
MRQKQSRPRLLQAMLDAFHLPDLRRRILFTIGILVLFRFVAHVPLPGINPDALKELFQSNALLGMLDMFSGGAMRNFSVAAMGVYPYITASIIMMLLVPLIPRLQALSQEGETGRHRVDQITHWLMIPLGAIQAYGQLVFLQGQGVFTSSGPLPMVR